MVAPMDRYKLLSIIIISIYLVSLSIYVTSGQDYEEEKILLEYFYDSNDCSYCDEIDLIIQEEKQMFKDNITIRSYPVDDETNSDNLLKMNEYGYVETPLLVIRNTSAEQHDSFLNYSNIKDKNYLESEIQKHVNGTYTEVVIELFIFSGDCDDCDEGIARLNNDILPIYGKNLTVKTFKVDNSGNYNENLRKYKEYGFDSTPGILVRNLSAGSKYNIILSYYDIINTKDRLLEKAVEMHISGNYTNLSKSSGFFVGDLDLSEFSLPVLTIVLGALDSVNPCSFFILLFLLSILLHTRSRKRMLLIGSIFIFFSGLIYFIIMVLLLQAFSFTGEQLFITLLAGAIAIVFGILNIKDFFFFKKGPSASIPESQKPKLYKQMRKIVKITSMPALIIATIVLAISANTVELLCSLNLPVIYTAILTNYELDLFQSYIYILIYNIVYVIPLMIIVGITVITFGRRKLSELQGRLLKLFSGIITFVLIKI